MTFFKKLHYAFSNYVALLIKYLWSNKVKTKLCGWLQWFEQSFEGAHGSWGKWWRPLSLNSEWGKSHAAIPRHQVSSCGKANVSDQKCGGRQRTGLGTQTILSARQWCPFMHMPLQSFLWKPQRFCTNVHSLETQFNSQLMFKFLPPSLLNCFFFLGSSPTAIILNTTCSNGGEYLWLYYMFVN